MTPVPASFVPFAVAPTSTPSTTNPTPPDPIQQLLQQVGFQFANNPVFVITHSIITIVVLVLAVFGGRWLSGLVGRTPTPMRFERTLNRAGRLTRSSEDIVLGQWLSRLVTFCVWLAAVVVITITWLSDVTIAQTLKSSNVAAFVTDLAQRIVASLLVIALTLGIGRVLQRSLEVNLARSRHLNPNIVVLMGRILFVATLATGLVVVLAVWGTGVALPVTVIGAVTVALTLSLQDVLKNLVSGVYLLLERPFIIGDRITLSSYTGTIEDIEIRYTALRTEDGQRVIIPNSMLFSSPVVNMSTAAIRRDGFTVTVPDTGRDTIERVEEHVLAALDAAPDVVKQPRPEIAVTSAAGGKVALQVVYWMPMTAPDKRAEVFTRVLEQLRAELDSAELTTLDAASVS